MSEQKHQPPFVEISSKDAADFLNTKDEHVEMKRRTLLGERAIRKLAETGELVGVVMGYDKEKGSIPARMVNLGEDFGTVIHPETLPLPSAEEVRQSTADLVGLPEAVPTAEVPGDKTQPVAAERYELRPPAAEESRPRTYEDLVKKQLELGIEVDEGGVPQRPAPEDMTPIRPASEERKPMQSAQEENDEDISGQPILKRASGNYWVPEGETDLQRRSRERREAAREDNGDEGQPPILMGGF